MFSLVYLSRANQMFSESELLELLRISRENNSRLQVTGLLLYKDGNFIQLLEGEQETVNQLYQKISRDDRHVNVTTLFDGPIETREFPNWSMGFNDLKSATPDQLEGYSDFLEAGSGPNKFAADPSRGLQILLLFKKIG